MAQHDPRFEPISTALPHTKMAGNLASLMSFYDRYCRLAFSLALRILGDIERAESAVERAFLRLWRHPLFGVVPCPGTQLWILALVHEEAIGLLRDQERLVQEPSRETQLDTLISPAKEHMGRASPADRSLDEFRVLELAYFEGLTYPAIAERMGLDERKVLRLMRSGLQRRVPATQKEPVEPRGSSAGTRNDEPTSERKGAASEIATSSIPVASADESLSSISPNAQQASGDPAG